MKILDLASFKFLNEKKQLKVKFDRNFLEIGKHRFLRVFDNEFELDKFNIVNNIVKK